MKLFQCQHCGQLLYFENRVCEVCRRSLGYLPEAGVLSALDRQGAHWVTLAQPARAVKFCANADYDVCNWLLPADSPASLCAACRHNHTVPDLGVPENLRRWHDLELAKHRLFYALQLLDLKLADRIDDPQHGLVFEFQAEGTAPGARKVLTGHDNGRITLNIDEADDATREAMRQRMGEPYRTLVGHFRHEVGHYFWDVLVRDGGHLQACRAIFGDDRENYDWALKMHYREGPPPDWPEHFISAYATTHPWEDFAETWAHYLHILDTLETAHAFGLHIRPRVTTSTERPVASVIDPYRAPDIATIIDAWLPLTFAMNSLSRSMGQPDLYPFILSRTAIRKLGFVHDLVHGRAPADPSPQPAIG